jgi:hypothetical protein
MPVHFYAYLSNKLGRLPSAGLPVADRQETPNTSIIKIAGRMYGLIFVSTKISVYASTYQAKPY